MQFLSDFPVDNLPSLVALLNNCPTPSPLSAIERLYPFQTFLPKEGVESVEDTLTTFQLLDRQAPMCTVKTVDQMDEASAQVGVEVDGTSHKITVPSGTVGGPQANAEGYVPTYYHESFVGELMLSHAVKDFCVIGPKGCGKSMLIDRMGQMLGYEVEHILLYQVKSFISTT